MTVRYAQGVAALHGVNFSVDANEVLAIVGESGSGKSTLALALMGLLPETARVDGSVLLSGRELLGRSDAHLSRIRGKEMSMVFQDAMSALTPVRTVGDQIAEAVRVHSRVGRTAARARAAELLGLVGVAARRAGAYPHELSGGMRQRALIAMAIANGPSVVIADEPTASLDVTVQAQVMDVLRAVKDATGAAILLISHDLGVVAGLADRVLVLRAGRVVESGPVEQIYRAPAAPYTVELLRSLPRLDAPSPRRLRDGPVVLEVDGLVRHHRIRRGAGTVRAVDGIAFDVKEGETLALVGESGCGKTTALMEIMRLSRPRKGRISVLGQDTARLNGARRRALRRAVQMVFQDSRSSLNPRMRVADILAEPLITHGTPAPRERVGELLESVGLGPGYARRYPHGLSGGERQRVGIARALALEPRLLLLDEPVAALDASSRAGVMDLLEKRTDMACLFVAHDLAAVHRIAHRVAVMHMGRIVEIGPVDDVYGNPAHPYTRALLDAVPIPDPVLERRRDRVVLQGEPPDLTEPPAGCRFLSRCPRYAMLTATERSLCEEHDPAMAPGADRMVACHHPLVGVEAGR
nr:ABC transporter ATP-binding protein [Actinomadura chibensis]